MNSYQVAPIGQVESRLVGPAQPHRAAPVRIVTIDGPWVLVRPLEALGKTPILDIKPVLDKTV